MSYLLVHKSRVRANFDVSDFLIHVFFQDINAAARDLSLACLLRLDL